MQQQTEKAENAVDKVLNYIKNGISSGEFKSGGKLPTESELQAATGVGRGGVREAMKTLAANGIVDIRRGDGTYLSNAEDFGYGTAMMFKFLLADPDLKELCDCRDSLELSLMRLAIMNCTEDDLKVLDDLNMQMYLAVSKPVQDPEELYRLDMAFHAELGNTAKNTFFKDFYSMMMELFAPIIHQNYREGQDGRTGYETHKDIVAALRSRDFVRVCAAIHKSVDLFGDWRHYAQGFGVEVNK